MKLQRILSSALAAACIFIMHMPAFAQDPEQALLADFPPLSIDSVERAEDAIGRLPEARAILNRRFAVEKAECLERFFAASCLSTSRSRERAATKAVSRIEVEAKAFLRRERAAERDRAVAERARRAADSGGKAIPFSGAARSHGHNGPSDGEARDSSKRLHLESGFESDASAHPESPAAPATLTEPLPAEQGGADSNTPGKPVPQSEALPISSTEPDAALQSDSPGRPEYQAQPNSAAEAVPASIPQQRGDPSSEGFSETDAEVTTVPAAGSENR